MRTARWFILAVLCLLATGSAFAQSGIQWSGSAKTSVDRAAEMGVPVMFWITDSTKREDEELEDLKDAQRDAFRDPVVLELTERYFVPCRVPRNSRVIEEAQKLGLPTETGFYIALVTPDGKVLDRIDPDQVTQPEALAARLAEASHKYRDSVYEEKLKATLNNLEAPKAKLREALSTVWHMRIYGADQDIVGLLARKDLKPDERSRLYQLLASFGTAPCVNALLDAAPVEKPAMQALSRAEPAAIPTLLEALPTSEGDVSPRQLIAYRALAAIAKAQNVKDDKFWAAAKPEIRQKELDRVSGAAQAVFDSWNEREGRWR